MIEGEEEGKEPESASKQFSRAECNLDEKSDSSLTKINKRGKVGVLRL